MALADNCFSPVAVDSLYCRIYCSVIYELGFTSVHERHLPPTPCYNSYISYYGPRKSPLCLMYTFHQSELVTITLGVQVLSSQPASFYASYTNPLSWIAEQGAGAHLHFVTHSLSPPFSLSYDDANLITLCRIFHGFTHELSSTGRWCSPRTPRLKNGPNNVTPIWCSITNHPPAHRH